MLRWPLLQTIMFNNPELLHALLEHLTQALTVYVGYQIESGAQVRRAPAGSTSKPIPARASTLQLTPKRSSSLPT
jgi:uroporphyrinogen-III decarboxylase